jgi:hypothetical protein
MGRNDSGQLGNESQEHALAPAQLGPPFAKTVTPGENFHAPHPGPGVPTDAAVRATANIIVGGSMSYFLMPGGEARSSHRMLGL